MNKLLYSFLGGHFVGTGHTQHEMTSYCSMSSIFQFMEEKWQQKQQQQIE